jgi:hypothetical protein
MPFLKTRCSGSYPTLCLARTPFVTRQSYAVLTFLCLWLYSSDSATNARIGHVCYLPSPYLFTVRDHLYCHSRLYNVCSRNVLGIWFQNNLQTGQRGETWCLKHIWQLIRNKTSAPVHFCECFCNDSGLYMLKGFCRFLCLLFVTIFLWSGQRHLGLFKYWQLPYINPLKTKRICFI